MNGANHEGETDKGEGNKDAERSVGHFEGEKFSDPPLGAVESSEGDAGHGGRQGKGKIDKCVQCTAKWEVVSGENPGNEQADDAIKSSGQKGQAKTVFVAGNGALLKNRVPKSREAFGKGPKR